MITIREPSLDDESSFLYAMKKSVELHHPWVKAPQTSEEFHAYIKRSQQENQKSFLVLKNNEIAGVFNLNEIVRGLFQNAFLGFYAVSGFEAQGIMSAGLKLVLQVVFEELKLHRIEANIQPDNKKSIQLVLSNKFRYEGFSPRYLKINNQWQGHDHFAITYEEYIQDNPEVVEMDDIEIVENNPKWPELAKSEIETICALFPEKLILDIQHVGSTAIPGISAKPIIDIQIAVSSLSFAQIVSVPILQKLGYEFWADNPDKKRLFFAKGMPPYGSGRTHHVHIFESTSPHWIGKIAFRDYLINHPDTAKAYEKLKFDLAKKYQYDREQYTDKKAEFIKIILEKAALEKSNGILEELKKREPIFHHPELGTTRADFEKMTVEDYWEIGASGNKYDREECIETVVARYDDPDYIKNDYWETKDFECRQLSGDTYLLTYTLIQGKEKRVTRRSTIWKNDHGQWMILYHQGTMVGGRKVDQL